MCCRYLKKLRFRSAAEHKQTSRDDGTPWSEVDAQVVHLPRRIRTMLTTFKAFFSIFRFSLNSVKVQY